MAKKSMQWREAIMVLGRVAGPKDLESVRRMVGAHPPGVEVIYIVNTRWR